MEAKLTQAIQSDDLSSFMSIYSSCMSSSSMSSAQLTMILHLAASKSPTILLYLLSNSNSALSLMQARSSQGETILHIVCEKGYTIALKNLLMVHKMNINDKDDAGQTGMHKLALGRHWDLLEWTANKIGLEGVTTKDIDGKTVVDLMVEKDWKKAASIWNRLNMEKHYKQSWEAVMKKSLTSTASSTSNFSSMNGTGNLSTSTPSRRSTISASSSSSLLSREDEIAKENKKLKSKLKKLEIKLNDAQGGEDKNSLYEEGATNTNSSSSSSASRSSNNLPRTTSSSKISASASQPLKSNNLEDSKQPASPSRGWVGATIGKQRAKTLTGKDQLRSFMTSGDTYRSGKKASSSWEINSRDIQEFGPIGAGHFSSVSKGVWRGSLVAFKKVLLSSSAYPSAGGGQNPRGSVSRRSRNYE